MKNIKLVLEYDGTCYAGWQRQKNDVTIQQRIEESIFKITGEQVQTTGCSRTDSGVHAKEFVCNFYTSSTIPDSKIRDALNSKLPEDIRVLSSQIVDDKFHSRYDSKGKTYSYTILNREINSAINRNYSYHVKSTLSVENIKKGANFLVGTHDFASFRNIGSSVKTTVRTIKEINVIKEAEYIRVFATADGFLYNMMRIIVGTLIDVGTGKKLAEEIPEILLSCDRTKAGKSVPPQGLCLEKVYY